MFYAEWSHPDVTTPSGSFSDYAVGAACPDEGPGRRFEASHPALASPIWLRRIGPDDTDTPEWLTGWEESAAARTALPPHAGVLGVLDVGRRDGEVWILSEAAPPDSLAGRLDSGPLSPAEALRMARDVGAALAHLHAAGAVHGDCRPDAIHLDPAGVWRLGGLDAIRRTVAEPDVGALTGAPHWDGTVPWVAPEILRGNPPAPAADIYALGVCLHAALTGHAPFTGGTAPAVAGRILREQLRAPSADVSGLPDGVDALVGNCVGKEPRLRYPAITAVLADLRRIDVGDTVSKLVPSPKTHARSRSDLQARATSGSGPPPTLAHDRPEPLEESRTTPETRQHSRPEASDASRPRSRAPIVLALAGAMALIAGGAAWVARGGSAASAAPDIRPALAQLRAGCGSELAVLLHAQAAGAESDATRQAWRRCQQVAAETEAAFPTLQLPRAWGDWAAALARVPETATAPTTATSADPGARAIGIRRALDRWLAAVHLPGLRLELGSPIVDRRPDSPALTAARAAVLAIPDPATDPRCAGDPLVRLGVGARQLVGRQYREAAETLSQLRGEPVFGADAARLAAVAWLLAEAPEQALAALGAPDAADSVATRNLRAICLLRDSSPGRAGRADACRRAVKLLAPTEGAGPAAWRAFAVAACCLHHFAADDDERVLPLLERALRGLAAPIASASLEDCRLVATVSRNIALRRAPAANPGPEDARNRALRWCDAALERSDSDPICVGERALTLAALSDRVPVDEGRRRCATARADCDYAVAAARHLPVLRYVRAKVLVALSRVQMRAGEDARGTLTQALLDFASWQPHAPDPIAIRWERWRAACELGGATQGLGADARAAWSLAASELGLVLRATPRDVHALIARAQTYLSRARSCRTVGEDSRPDLEAAAADAAAALALAPNQEDAQRVRDVVAAMLQGE